MRLWVISVSNKKKRSTLSYALLTGILVAVVALASIAVAAVTDKQVIVSAWDRQVRVHNPGKTVREAVAAAGIVIGPEDRVLPDLDSPVKNGMEIEIRAAEPVFVVKVPSEKGPPRKVYSLNAQGREYLEEFWRTWSFLSDHIGQLRTELTEGDN